MPHFSNRLPQPSQSESQPLYLVNQQLGFLSPVSGFSNTTETCATDLDLESVGGHDVLAGLPPLDLARFGDLQLEADGLPLRRARVLQRLLDLTFRL